MIKFIFRLLSTVYTCLTTIPMHIAHFHPPKSPVVPICCQSLLLPHPPESDRPDFC